MSNNVNVLDSKSFDSAISSGVTLVDFYADWCTPCKMQAPIIDKVADKMTGKAKFCKINIDSAPDIASRYGIMSIPTVIVFKDGNAVEKTVGLTNQPEIESLVNNAI